MSYGNDVPDPIRSFRFDAVEAFSGTTYVSVVPFDVPPETPFPETVALLLSMILALMNPLTGTN
jgi:hypothetical protein